MAANALRTLSQALYRIPNSASRPVGTWNSYVLGRQSFSISAYYQNVVIGTNALRMWVDLMNRLLRLSSSHRFL